VKEYRISFIGAGKVSGALCRQLYLSGCKIRKIVSRNEKDGQSLAASCNAYWDPGYDFNDSENIIITAVPDDSLREVLGKIRCGSDTVVVHTAGSIGLDVFPEKIIHRGVFYPLQTFTQGRKVVFSGLPFFLEAADDLSSVIMTGLVELLGGEAHFTDTDKRQFLHIAAVFTCNFTNHMFTAGQQIIDKAGLPFNVMEPLINETVRKAIDIGPDRSQTGPAYRFDKETIKKHIDLLSFSPELQKIYREITGSIIRLYNKAENDQF
jgi:predicted short-subunit dehydrogenase-like oxidoreductase (DUF2520 family)